MVSSQETKAKKKDEPKVELTPEEKAQKQKDRDQLVEQYMPFATYIVRKVSKTVSASVDFDDLMGYAKVGLIEAAERFDSRYKVDFRTFAFYRIRGAIYDGLRTQGWLSRTQFSKHQFEEAANHYMRANNDRVAAGGASKHGSATAEIKDSIMNLASVYIMSLDAAEGLQVKDEVSPTADSSCELAQTRDRVRQAIEKLPEKERQLIKLYYYGGMTLDEAGVSLGLSRSWTSRLHARALEQLQKIIKEISDEGEFEQSASNANATKNGETKKRRAGSRKRSKSQAKTLAGSVVGGGTRC